MKWMPTFMLCWLALCFSFPAASQPYDPQPNWKDSYAVDGRCYCDSNGFDHGLDTKTAPTPFGRKNVVQICADIERVLGAGPLQGRVPYNDIQCGNGPANDAADETGCPGRVDIGPAGCDQIGPTWDLKAVYGNAPGTMLARIGWTLDASSNAGQAFKAIDDDPASKWSTGAAQTPGQFFLIDLGTIHVFNRLTLDTSSSPREFPRAVRLLVSDNGSHWRRPTIGGGVARPFTDLYFATQAARYVRIEQTGGVSTDAWSIHDLALFQTEDPAIYRPELPADGWAFTASSNAANAALTIDGSSATRWATGAPQAPGQFFQIDLQRIESFDGLQLTTQANPEDYPRGYRVLVSDDSATWRGPVASGSGNGPTTTIRFPWQQARYIRIEQTGSAATRWWSIHELFVDKAYKRHVVSRPLPPVRISPSQRSSESKNPRLREDAGDRANVANERPIRLRRR
jgi:hypothetical protein